MKEVKIGDKINNWIVYDGPFLKDNKTEYDLQCALCGRIRRFSYRYIISPAFSKACRSCS